MWSTVDPVIVVKSIERELSSRNESLEQKKLSVRGTTSQNGYPATQAGGAVMFHGITPFIEVQKTIISP